MLQFSKTSESVHVVQKQSSAQTCMLQVQAITFVSKYSKWRCLIIISNCVSRVSLTSGMCTLEISWLLSKSSTKSKSARTSINRLGWLILYPDDRHQWWELYWPLRPRYRTAVFAVDSWQSPRLKKASQVRSVTKSMLVVFSEISGVAHQKFWLTKHPPKAHWKHWSFSPATTQLPLPTPSTHCIWLPATSLCSKKMKFGLWVLAVDPSFTSMMKSQMHTYKWSQKRV